MYLDAHVCVCVSVPHIAPVYSRSKDAETFKAKLDHLHALKKHADDLRAKIDDKWREHMAPRGFATYDDFRDAVRSLSAT